MINAGSFSRLDIFESCPKRAELAFVHKIKEPDRDPLPAGREYPNDRGERVHKQSEDYVKGVLDAPPLEMKPFAAELKRLRELHEEGQAIAEEMWCFDDGWSSVPWNAWNQTRMRIKTDATVFLGERAVVIIDYKTGRRFGNEVKHAQQLQLYGIGAVMKYPDIEEVTCELWYPDQDELISMDFKRKHALNFVRHWNDRLQKMLTATKFPARPNKNTCKWCPYAPWNTGHCDKGVR
jgi:hypothetical protein